MGDVFRGGYEREKKRWERGLKKNRSARKIEEDVSKREWDTVGT